MGKVIQSIRTAQIHLTRKHLVFYSNVAFMLQLNHPDPANEVRVAVKTPVMTQHSHTAIRHFDRVPPADPFVRRPMSDPSGKQGWH